MTSADLIPAAEATKLLGYKNRSSLTRLVQSGQIAPSFTASGARGEQFFKRADVLALLTPAVAPSSPEADGSTAGVSSSANPMAAPSASVEKSADQKPKGARAA